VSDAHATERTAERLAPTNGEVTPAERPSVVRGLGQVVADEIAKRIPKADLD